MKRFSFYVISLCVALCTGISLSFAAPTSTLSSTAPIVGTGAGQNAGVLLFDYLTGLPDTQRVSINADPSSLVFTGTFWTENAGWCTFGELGADGAKLQTTANTDILTMTGFAWCQNAGWISFNPTGSISSPGTDVYFTKSTGLFHGFAWSDNLGWISMEGLMTDITPPSLSNFAPFSASESKVFVINDMSPSMIPSGSSYDYKVQRWDSAAATVSSADSDTLTGNVVTSFTHDFRKAKQYYLKITDPFGNSSEGNVQVVADIPSETLDNAHKIALGATATTYTGTFATSKVADGTQVHSMELKLRDQYGNVVKNESTTDTPAVAIKTVTVSVAFNNTVSKDQVNGGGNAIKYPLGTIGLALGGTDSGTGSEDSGNYKLDIVSYAPTSSGYSFTTPGNNISLHKLTYEVTGVGGTSGQIEKKDKFGTNNLKFSPALYIGSVANTDNWAIRQGYDSTFTATLLTGTTVALTGKKVAHILDINSNILMSYQNPSNIIGGTKYCDGFNKTISTFNSTYTSTDTACYRPDSSNILLSNPSSSMSFSWKPTIIYAAPTNSTVKYSSEISYTTGSVSVKYPSYSRTNNGATITDPLAITPTDVGSGVINQSVKILGMATGRNTIDMLSGNSTNAVGSLTRTDIKNAIHKNVELMTKGGATEGTKYRVYPGDKTISSWPDLSKDTIIIKGGNLTINGNIIGGAAIRGIIVLQDANGNGGNIYIKDTVRNIDAVLYADKSVISGTSAPSSYYSDTQSATGQLFLNGSMISDNTIGGASMTPLKCPYNVSCNTGNATNDDKMAKRYDLNYFRFYSGTGTLSPGAAMNPQVPAGTETYPFVIKYDNRLQTAPPPGFKIAQ